MKARIVDVAELKKTPEEREAEELLKQLGTGKAIEITLAGDETPRTVARLYRVSAKRLQKEIRVRTIEKGAKVIVAQRERPPAPF